MEKCPHCGEVVSSDWMLWSTDLSGVVCWFCDDDFSSWAWDHQETPPSDWPGYLAAA